MEGGVKDRRDTETVDDSRLSAVQAFAMVLQPKRPSSNGPATVFEGQLTVSVGLGILQSSPWVYATAGFPRGF